MKKLANIVGTAMAGIGGLGLSLLFLGAEFAAISANWVQFFNPLLTLAAMLALLAYPITWLIGTVTMVGIVVVAVTDEA